MGFETVFRLREVELEYEGAAGTLTISSDLPGNALAVRHAASFPATATTRRTVRLRVPRHLKGKLWQWNITSEGELRLFGGRVFGKAGAADWAWYALPIEPTPEAWSEVPLPIEPTPEAWSDVPLPIEPTPEAWSDVPLPIEPTPEAWTEVKIPIRPTPELPEYQEIPIAP